MKILLAIGIHTPEISKQVGTKETPLGGWLIDFINNIGACKEFDLIVCFPLNSKKSFKINNVTYISYPCITYKNYKNKNIYISVKNLLQDISPDILHIYGLEYPFANTFAHHFDKCKTVGTIQGIISKCAIHYDNQIPFKITKCPSIGDILLKQGSINKQKRNFIKLGQIEEDTYRNLKYITGRTKWDMTVSLMINPNLQYFHCNEILRPEFQKNALKWNYDKCIKRRIFVSQASYSLKGLHQLIQACGLLISDFPDLEIVIGGADIISRNTLVENLKASSYSNYLKKLIRENNLEGNIRMVGFLSAEDVIMNLLLTNIYICPSSIENSSNSIAEAIVIGTPIIASKVGGNEDFVIHNNNGLTYPFDEYYILASHIKRLFLDKELCNTFKINSLKLSRIFDPERNIQKMKEIYLKIEGNKNA